MWRALYVVCTFVLASSATFLYGDALQRNIDQATLTIQEFAHISEESILKDVLKNAQGLAILTVVKAGFFLTGRGAEGIVIAKTSDGWSAPTAIEVGEFNFPVDDETTDFVLIFNTREAMKAFAKKEHVTLGADVSVAAGPVGRIVNGMVLPDAAVYTYSRSGGLFAGASLKGTLIAEHKKADEKFYEGQVTAKQLLSGKVNRPESAKLLYQALHKYAD
jgi:SH3 domain-containing YSC84-like protein 1